MRFRILIASILFLGVATMAGAQDAQQMLQGGGRPVTLNPDGLTDDFKAVQIKTSGSGENSIMDMIMSPMMMIMGAMGAMGGGKDQPPVALITAMNTEWTRGDTQTMFGQTYLAVYKLDIDLGTMAAPPKDLSGLSLRLQFIRTDSIQSVTPRPDITRAEYMKMLKTPLPKQETPAAGGGGN